MEVRLAVLLLYLYLALIFVIYSLIVDTFKSVRKTLLYIYIYIYIYTTEHLL
jgi:hypothetical protein